MWLYLIIQIIRQFHYSLYVLQKLIEFTLNETLIPKKRKKKRRLKLNFLKLSKNLIGVALFPLYYLYSIIVFGF